MAAKKRGLGRGLDALLGETEASVEALRHLPIEQLKPGKYQPRELFAQEAMDELAASIKAQGLMQPIVVRQLEPESYEIIAGERRWRAAQLAGLGKVPVLLRKISDENALVLSLIENIQREDLNPLEEAKALRRLIDEFQFTHEVAAEAVGKSRSAVTNLLRLSQLPEPVAEMLMNGELEMGHARALLTLDAATQLSIARQIRKDGLNVRQTELLVRKAGQTSNKKKSSSSKHADPDTKRLERGLAQQLGQPVKVHHTAKGKGRLEISYASLDELTGVLKRLGYSED